MPISQDEQRRTLLEQTRAHVVRIEPLNRLSPEQMSWSRPDGGWNVAQILEHLVVTNDCYMPMMDRLAQEASVKPQPDETWKPSLAGRLLIKSMTSPRRFKAPKLFGDVKSPRPNVLGAFANQLQRIEALLQASNHVSWRRTRTASPVSRFIRLNLGDCYTVLPTHNERHLGQIDRLMNHAQFPATTESGRTKA